MKEDFISVPMPLDDDFGDANGFDEPELFRKLQPSIRLNAQNSNINLDSMQKKRLMVDRVKNGFLFFLFY